MQAYLMRSKLREGVTVQLACAAAVTPADVLHVLQMSQQSDGRGLPSRHNAKPDPAMPVGNIEA